jgi:hypothetical protein
MNWRRGLLRLWLVLSLGWIVSFGVYLWNDNAWISSRTTACFEARRAEGASPYSCLDPNEFLRRARAPVELADVFAAAKEYAVYAFLPPLIALVLGLLGAWVVSGFARKGA